MSDVPQEISAAYSESDLALNVSVVGASATAVRSTLDPYRIWRDVIDEDTGVVRVVTV